jgi:hypothetical protein
MPDPREYFRAACCPSKHFPDATTATEACRPYADKIVPGNTFRT